MYSLYGLKKAKLMLVNHPEAEEIFDIFKKADDLRCCESETDAGDMVKQYKFGLDYVPAQYLASQEVICFITLLLLSF